MPKTTLHQVRSPTGGVNFAIQPTDLLDQFSPNCRNIRFETGELFKRYGYVALSSCSVSGIGTFATMSGAPVLLDEFRHLDTTVNALLATTFGLFKWDGTYWSSITTGLSGAADGYHSATIMNDTWVYTNGVDHVQKYAAGSINASDLTGGSDYQAGDYHVCRAVLQYADRLLLLSTTEDAADLAQRVRWSELGKIDEYNENEGGGYFDTSDPGRVVAGELIGDYAAIYKEHSTWLCIYTGGVAPADPFRFIMADPERGTPAPRTVARIGTNEHILMGEDDVYRFNGQSMLPVGQPIRDELFPLAGRTYRKRAFGFVDTDRHLYYLFVPQEAEQITRAYIYDYQLDSWTVDDASNVTAGAIIEFGTALTIDGMDVLSDTIETLPGRTIDELGAFAGRYSRIIADGDGNVYEDNNATVDDAGVAIDGYYETKDFSYGNEHVNRYKRVLAIIFEAKGDAVTVDYSTDRGQTWGRIGTQALTEVYTRYKLNFHTSARLIRFRFRNNTLTERFYVRWYATPYQLTGMR